MREFRGKITKKENREHAFNNVWVYGDLVVSGDKYYIHPRANAFQVNNELSKLIVLHEVIPETIGQYTGLTDKNGKKIFDGDIVKGCWNTIFEIYFDDCYLQYRAAIKSGLLKEIDYYGESYRLEVIGNKWDNPELL